jgi:hypothetical protein
MEIRCWFEGLTIKEADPTFLNAFHSNPAQIIEQGNRVYSISGREWRGFVVVALSPFERMMVSSLRPAD